MIKASGVSKYFGNTLGVDDISFEVAEKETLVLLGTSGCGKTTTLRMINRLIEASRGSIEIEGKDIRSQSPYGLRRTIGYVMQQNGLFPHYTIAENISIVPKLLGWDTQKIAVRTEEMVAKLHLKPEQLALFPRQLSGGEQQRVGLARALIANPSVLLMDEPFGALDTITRTSIRKEFSELEEFRRKTIVMVTHDVQEAFELGDRICLMDKGRIMQTGTPAALLFHPENDFVKKFLDQQRLQLELQSVTLKDVSPYLTDRLLVPFDDNRNLWQIIGDYTTAGEATPANGIAQNATTFPFASIFDAYRKYKKTIAV